MIPNKKNERTSNRTEESHRKDVIEMKQLEDVSFPKYHPLQINLPKTEYFTNKISIIPLNRDSSHNWRFRSIKDAAIFLFKHCQKHHKTFSLKFAQAYSQFCFVFDDNLGEMVPLHNFHKRLFTQCCQKLIRNSR
jgi:hypothetical protein